MSANPQRRARPMIVTFAVIILILGMTIRFVHVFSGAHVDKQGAYLFLAVLVGIPYLIIWFIFLGKNWARWVFLIVFGMALCSLSVRVQQLPSVSAEEMVTYGAQVLFCAIAAVALLSGTAVDWFREKNNDT